MASGTLPAQGDYVRPYMLAKNTSVNIYMNGNVCAVSGNRIASNISFIDFFDFWSDSYSTVAGTHPSILTYTKSTNSFDITITNSGSGAVPLLLIGARVV